MTFGRSVRICMSKYAVFTGRASRSEFWRFFLFTQFILLNALFFDSVIWSPLSGLEPISILATLALLLPYLAVGARRLHDIGASGWWLLLMTTPLLYALYAVMPFSGIMQSDDWSLIDVIIAHIGHIILLVVFALPTNPAKNKYDPEEESSPAHNP